MKLGQILINCSSVICIFVLNKYAMNFKRILGGILFILVVFSSRSFATEIERPIFRVTIENDNLFVCLEIQPPDDVQTIDLKLKGGKKITIYPAEGKDCKTLFYLDSRQAKEIKKRGIKSIVYHCKTASKKVIVTLEQNLELVSFLP